MHKTKKRNRMPTTLDSLKQMLEGFIDTQKAHNKNILDDVHTIKRGVYGDEKNKVKGLIQTDIEQHERIKSLEDTRRKFIYMATAAVLVIEGLIHLLKSFN